MTTTPPVVLTIAGSDCSAGAGIQADLKTFQHFHTHGLTAITCVVSETAEIVREVHPVPIEIVADQVALMMDSFPVAAVKTGMLYSAEIVRKVAEILQNFPNVPLVVDPVMIASTGASLLELDAILAYRELLLPMATVITPNLPEAEALLGLEIQGESALAPSAQALAAEFSTSVLLKGGHLPGPSCTDLLIHENIFHRYSSPRLEVAASHGTGCTLSAAIAACLANGQTLPEAVANSKSYLTATLASGYGLTNARGTIHALNQGTLDFSTI
ncbi:bifunctional hydroxymethylpyrimidine kinase/phosphomethylpyrimidine kinase [Luteolibacter pohnpeiensis]|uniref:hydroxymethylpyrimidine kinase n=1 Tax=Luteolibacter pohnpeiensis TaxID=454153 RepID=A0A934S7I7_9BACT|nr:bifunctional hydroxymethylpyrimidine kinase/phosphomethylpyrimidine kinase [Luteolibacter pohnpeiensis]MBK1882659.1 bifunctional hydroxymethylpyrimidine kinase/phosphomethylpyrimidine kinase [Luteolibacter pohnpeiensis]